MAKALVKVGDKVMATGGKLLLTEKIDVDDGFLVPVYDPINNDEIELVVPPISITKKRYLNSFIGNAEIIIE